MDKKVIIIGAGLAGLSAGCYAQKNGFGSHIFGHHAVPGGVAAAWKRQEYLIDGGVHFIMGYKPGTALHQIFEDIGASEPMLYVDAIQLICHDEKGRFILERSAHGQ